jgi:hypothetical protein
MGVMGLSNNIQQPWKCPKEHRDANHQKQGELTKKKSEISRGVHGNFMGLNQHEPTELVNGGFNGETKKLDEN